MTKLIFICLAGYSAGVKDTERMSDSGNFATGSGAYCPNLDSSHSTLYSALGARSPGLTHMLLLYS